MLQRTLVVITAFAMSASTSAASETISTSFSTGDGFETFGTAPVTLISGDFETVVSGGQQIQFFDGPSYNTGPDAYLFVSGPSFTGASGNSTTGTGDIGLIDFNQAVDSVSFYAADRANGTPTLRVFGRDDTTVLFEAQVTQTSNRTSDGSAVSVFTAASLGGLIGSIEIDNAGPAGNPPYATAIDTLTAVTNVVFAEEVSGDASNGAFDNGAAPTPVDFTEGSNVITGTVVDEGDTNATTNDIRDYFTFTIDPGYELDSILQLEHDDPNGSGGLFDGNRGFYALYAGVDNALPAFGNNLGGDHLDPIGFGADLLPSIAGGGISSSQGFDLPLQAGTYTFLVQQTGPQVSNYGFDFVVSAVPEPSTGLLTLAILSTRVFRRRG